VHAGVGKIDLRKDFASSDHRVGGAGAASVPLAR